MFPASVKHMVAFLFINLEIFYGLDIELLLLMPMDKLAGGNLYWVGPALYTVIDQVNREYNNTGVRIVPVASKEMIRLSCTAANDNSGPLLAKHYYERPENACLAIIMSACAASPETAALSRGLTGV